MADQCDKARNCCFPVWGPAVGSPQSGLKPLSGPKWGLHPPHLLWWVLHHFCLSGLNTERTRPSWMLGLLGKLSELGLFHLLSPTLPGLIGWARHLQAAQKTLLSDKRKDGVPCTTSPKVLIVSKAVINLDCKTSQYLVFICVKSTIAKQQVPFDLSPGQKASHENKYTVKQSAHWREIQHAVWQRCDYNLLQ